MRRAVAALAAATLLGCSSGGGSVKELCTAVRANGSSAAVFSGFDPSDTERALEQLRSARVTLGELRDAAPKEVRDELGVEIAYIQALIDGLAPLDGSDAARAVEVVRQVTADHPKVTEAAATLDAFTKEQCGSG